MYHRSAFIGLRHSRFRDPRARGMTDMLIRNAMLGRNLADALGDHPAALMRGHGAVITDHRCRRGRPPTIFLALNATLQADACA